MQQNRIKINSGNNQLYQELIDEQQEDKKEDSVMEESGTAQESKIELFTE